MSKLGERLIASARRTRMRLDGTRHLTIAELEPGDCKWIMNDDTSNAEYCGLPCCAASAVYCADHHQRAYVRPAAPRGTFRHYR